MSAKDDVRALLERLPDDCTLEDVQYHLYVAEKVRQSIDASDSKGTLSHDEVEARMNKWTSHLPD